MASYVTLTFIFVYVVINFAIINKCVFLEAKLSDTKLSDMRNIFYQLIEEQTKTIMLAEVSSEYILKTIDPSNVPDEKASPARAIIVIMVTMLGGMLSVLLALLLAPYLRKFGKFTVPDFIGDRYYSNVARSVAVFCALLVSFTYVAGQMRGVGLVFSRFLEVNIDTGVLIGMFIVLFYAVLGGMKGITYM